MSDSMISGHDNEEENSGKILQKYLFEEQASQNQNQSKGNADFDDFGDYKSDRMGDSMISGQEGD